MMKMPPETQSVHPLDLRLKRLKYRAWHRGFKEADLILGPFADVHVDQMSIIELEELEQLLTVPDQDLYDWILGSKPPEPAFDGEVLKALQSTVAKLKSR